MVMHCGLCHESTDFFVMVDRKKYHHCQQCGAVFLDPQHYLSSVDEKKRYEQHNNDVNDLNYQQFVMPMVRRIQEQFKPYHRGLDFGAGQGPVVTKLLADHGFSVRLYDPFFFNDHGALEQFYDYIVCCEVIEHFFSPAKEFQLLRSLLKEEGALFCKTELLRDDIDFSQWYYKNDPTHVFFYRSKTLLWIQQHFSFSYWNIHEGVICFGV